MAVFDSIRSALGLGKAADGDPAAGPAGSDLDDARIAAAALAVHVIAVDGVVEDSERATLRQSLAREFSLSETDTDALIEIAQERDRDAVDLYGFTSVLNRRMDEDGRLRVVEMLWEMVYADGTVHEFEDNTLWRIAELLHVPPRERIRLRKLVEGHSGDG